MRLDKFICDTTGITRSKAKSLILAGKVYVNGILNRDSKSQVDTENDHVLLDNKKIEYSRYKYIMLNKPAGVVCANADKKYKTVFDLLDESTYKRNMFVCGRLDRDSTGFVLLTNDGPLAHILLSPKSHVSKVYEVVVKNDDTLGYEQAFAKGIKLDGNIICRPAVFLKVDTNICRLEIVEGKFHQVKRMFEALGNKVLSLKRIKFADIDLDVSLKEGEFRYLSDFEQEKLLAKRTKK